ncbi:MAG: ester cyclase, partial [Dehalococcoidia bacterium]|nr:ester cyclase [Dehalococcoidia bacterium]
MADRHAAYKAAIHRLIDEALNHGKVEVIDELVSPHFVNHGSGRRPISDREALKRAFRLEKAAFPDLTFTIDDMIAEGDRVMYRGTARGTQAQPFADIPATGRSFTIME